jgi:ABC transport system ATP-binding/permease protein
LTAPGEEPAGPRGLTSGLEGFSHRAVSGVFSGIHEAIGKCTRIGRDLGNEIVVDDPLVSRFHAELRARSDGRHELVDLGSRNGTFVNGRAVDRAILEELDIVSVGHHAFRLVGSGLAEYIDAGSITFQAAGLEVHTPTGRSLLSDVSFGLDERSFLAVVGPSGAGKSTLLNALTGFHPASAGRVFYDGRDLYEDYDELRLRLGFVSQGDVLYEGLTLGETMEYGAQLRFPRDVGSVERRVQIELLLDQLGLARMTEVVVKRLSGGQRRRVAVAVELITKPSLLFLDEPTSGLDPGNERAVMKMLRQLADGGRTVIVVTHSMQSIRLCDRLLVLAPGGRLAYFGSPQLAPAFFGCDDLQDVFQLLNTDPGRDWGAALRSDPDYVGQLEATLPEELAVVERTKRPRSHPAGPRALIGDARRWSSQFGVLVRRYVRVIAGDRRNLALLVLQPVILGVLMLVALPAHELAAPGAGQVRAVSRAGLVLLVILVAATWIGASNAVREIVRELPILQRERAAGVRVVPYIASKVAVLGTLTVAQCTVLALIALARSGSHDQGSLLGSPVPELVIAAILAGVAGMALALLISSLVATADQALTVLPVVLLLELLLAMGGLFPDVVDKPVLKQLSYAATTQWSFAAAASSVDLGRMQALDSVGRDAPTIQLDDPIAKFESLATSLQEPSSWQHEPSAWLEDVGAVVLISGVALVGAGIAVARRRPEA